MLDLKNTTNLEIIGEAIQRSTVEKQRQLLARLPRLLHLDFASFGLLKLAEDSFDFWNNPEDAIYDTF